MSQYKLVVSPQFYFSNSNGGSNLILDSVVNKDHLGLPYISGTAIKGLLLESMEEVLAMQGKSFREIGECTDLYFGKPGDFTTQGWVTIKTARLPLYSDAYNFLDKHRVDPALSRSNVSHYFTNNVSQTRINKEGIADDGSLRTLEVVDNKKADTFEALISIRESVDFDEDLFQYVIYNVWHLGINRNRGLGRVQLSIDFSQPLQKEECLGFDDSEEHISVIKFSIKTNDPVVLSTQRGDQNTILTEDVISGSKIFGVLAYHLFNSVEHDAKKLFEEIFLSGQLNFSDARVNGGIVMPMNLQKAKYIEDSIVNQFSEQGAQTPSSTIHGYIKNGALCNPRKSFVFHNSRRNRTAGSSQDTDDYGSIFYYECLDAFQTFQGEITGDSALLKKLTSFLPQSLNVSFGASRSVQYGSCTITFELYKEAPAKINDEVLYFICQSPCILLNDQFCSAPDTELLKKEIGLNIEQSLCRQVGVKSYNAQWGGKAPVYNAFKPGSVFKVLNPEKLLIDKYTYFGIHADRGFGQFYVANQEELKSWTELSYGDKPETIEDTTDEQADILYINNIIKEYKSRIRKLKSSDIPNRVNRIELTNNQISNLLQYLTYKGEKEWKDYLEFVKEKKIGKKLQSEGIYNDLFNGISLITDKPHDTFNLFVSETTEILQRLRMTKI